MQEVLLTSLKIEDLKRILEDCIQSVLWEKQDTQTAEEKFPEDLLSITDLVKLFNVSKVTIHKWKKKGLIPFYKMNRRVYFKKSEVIKSMAHKSRKLDI